MEHPPDLLTNHELAVKLRVSPDTVSSWARRGVIPCIKLSRKAIRFDYQAVVTALATLPAKGDRDAK